MHNPTVNDYIDVIYPEELEIKDTTDAPKWANYLDRRLEVNFSHDSYEKRDDFDFTIVNFPYLSIIIGTLHVMLGFVRNMKMFCSEDLFWFQSY